MTLLRAFVLLLAGCAAATPASLSARQLPVVTLVGPDGVARSTDDLRADAKATVFIFFSAHCPCQAAHDARVRDLDARYRPLGVRFFAVDSEISASPGADAAEARTRGYSFPIFVDHGASFASAVGAEFATFSILIDEKGEIRYHGGIDSDRTHLQPSAEPYLANAIEDLLAGRTLRVIEGKALGCSLRKS